MGRNAYYHACRNTKVDERMCTFTCRCGEDHTLVVLRSGALYAMGGNAFGQLGMGDSADRALPVAIPGLRDEKVPDRVLHWCTSA